MDAYGSGLLTEAIVGAQEYENGEATRTAESQRAGPDVSDPG